MRYAEIKCRKCFRKILVYGSGIVYINSRKFICKECLEN